MLSDSAQLVCYVATADVGRLPVYDNRSGELFDPELVKQGRQPEKLNMQKRQLYDRAPISEAKGKKIRSTWLDEARVQGGRALVRSRCVAMEFNVYDRLDT